MRSEVAWYGYNDCTETKTKTFENMELLEFKSWYKNHTNSDLIFVVFLNVQLNVYSGF